jgi:SAM-dependent methyltransferase
MLPLDAKRIVADGYDLAAERYVAWSRNDPIRLHQLRRLTGLLPARSRVLDIGCGSGIPVAQELARLGHRVTGIDISARQVALARQNVPEAEFIHGDVMGVALPRASFDAVTAFFSLTHLPRSEHAALLACAYGWLRPKGLLLASFGVRETDWVEDDWLGVPMFFSHFDAATK